MDIAWDAQEGGEFVDEYESNLDLRAVPFLTVRDMVDEVAFDDTVRHKDTTVRRRMRQPYGPMLTDTLLTNGLPPPGTAGDPNAPRPAPKVLMYKPLDDPTAHREQQHSPRQENRGDAHPPGLGPHDSVTQAYNDTHQYHDTRSYDSRDSRYSSCEDHGQQRRAVPASAGAFTDMYQDALRQHQSSASGARRTAYSVDDNDDGTDQEEDARLPARKQAQHWPVASAAQYRPEQFESMGTATLLEAGPVSSAPSTRATLMNLNRRVHKQRRRVQSKRRARRDAAENADGGSVSDTSSMQRAEDKLRQIRSELEEEERVQYITYLREAHADGLCSEPRADASAVELRCTFESVVCNRERIVRVNRAMMVMVALVFAVELVLRVFGVPVRVRGMGVFFQRAMQSGQYDEFLERVYETTLSSYSWNGTWETVFTIGALLVGFMMVKYLGDGNEERPAPFGPAGLMVPPELDGKNGNMNDVLDTLGGMRNITSLYNTFQNGTWSRTGRRAAPQETAFDNARAKVQQGSRNGPAAASAGGGGGVRLPTAAATSRRGHSGSGASQRPVAKAGAGPVTTEPPSSDEDE